MGVRVMMVSAPTGRPVAPRTIVEPYAGALRRPHTLPIAASVAAIWLSVADIPTRISLGPISFSGAATIVVAVASLLAAPMIAGRRARGLTRSEAYLVGPSQRRVLPFALVLFATIATVSLFLEPTLDGLQNVAVYVGFAGIMASVATYSTAETGSAFYRLLHLAALLMGVAGILSFTVAPGIYGPRAYALAAMVAVAALVPQPRGKLLARLTPVVLVIAIAASLSRTALVIAVLLLAFLALRSQRNRSSKIMLMLLTAGAAGVAAFVNIPALRDRFLTGDNALMVGGVALNTSGRSQLWNYTWESIVISPWVGHGPGSAAALISARYSNISHPHNDYLRIWHDFGFLGLLVFVAAILALLLGAVRRLRYSDADSKPYHWAAILALAAVATAASTDNVVVYPFIMLPLAAVVGVSIGRPVTVPHTPHGRGASEKTTRR